MQNSYPIEPLIFPKIGGTSRHDKYMNMLSKIAIAVEPVAHARIAACVVYKNEIISFGINQKKSHPFQAIYGTNKESIFLHAETDAIKNALKIISVSELTKASLYICRVKYEACNKNKFIF
jgi:deoxycytidylate deaminase